MLGWMISVHRQLDGGSSPATSTSPKGPALATWQTGSRGLDWLNALVEEDKASDLGGNGYPLWYTARAQEIVPLISTKPPLANENWSVDAGDGLLPHWLGKTTIDASAIEACRPGEWLVIEAWDES